MTGKFDSYGVGHLAGFLGNCIVQMSNLTENQHNMANVMSFGLLGDRYRSIRDGR